MEHHHDKEGTCVPPYIRVLALVPSLIHWNRTSQNSTAAAHLRQWALFPYTVYLLEFTKAYLALSYNFGPTCCPETQLLPQQTVPLLIALLSDPCNIQRLRPIRQPGRTHAPDPCSLPRSTNDCVEHAASANLI